VPLLGWRGQDLIPYAGDEALACSDFCAGEYQLNHIPFQDRQDARVDPPMHFGAYSPQITLLLIEIPNQY
jgi:hypothetical protein